MSSACSRVTALSVLVLVALALAACSGTDSTADQTPSELAIPSPTPVAAVTAVAVPAAETADAEEAEDAVEIGEVEEVDQVEEAPAVLMLNGDLSGGVISFEEFSANATSVLGEPVWHSTWQLTDGELTADASGWVIWGDDFIDTLDPRVRLEGFEDYDGDINTLAPNGLHWIRYTDAGERTGLCTPVICITSAAGNKTFEEVDDHRVTIIFDLVTKFADQAVVIDDELVPQRPVGVRGDTYNFAAGQEVWVESSYELNSGTYWVGVVTDDHRRINVPMDRLRPADSADGSPTLRDMLLAEQADRIAALESEHGPATTLELRADGFGHVAFGGSFDEAVDYAISVLGEPATLLAVNGFRSDIVVWDRDGVQFWITGSSVGAHNRWEEAEFTSWQLGNLDSWWGVDDRDEHGSPRQLSRQFPVTITGLGNLPLAAEDISFGVPWGCQRGRCRASNGIEVDLDADNEVVHIAARESAGVAERWIADRSLLGPAAPVMDGLENVDVGDKVWVDQTPRGSRDTVFIYTSDNQLAQVYPDALSDTPPD